MDSKKEYLKKYNKNIVILDNIELEKHIENIPERWQLVLREKEFSIKLTKLIELWSIYLSSELRNTIAYLSLNLKSLDLLYDGIDYSLLYGISTEKGKVLYYEGKFVLDLGKNIELKNSWDALPQSIKDFYEKLHNGFYYYASHSMGLVSEDEVTNFSEYDWSIIDELEEPIKINLDSTFGFFTNGMGTYIAVDCENCSEENATLWFKNKSPKYNINFWDVVDEWIVIGFQA